MRPLTDRRPKPLLPVGDRTLIEYVFDTALDVVDEFVVVTGYRGEAIRETLGGSYRDHPVTYVRQEDPLGTAHAIAQAAPVVDDDFLVLNGDVVVDASPPASACRRGREGDRSNRSCGSTGLRRPLDDRRRIAGRDRREASRPADESC